MKTNKKRDDVIWIIIEIMVIVIGIVILAFGIKGIVDKSIETKDYVKVDATFEGTDVEDVEGGTYSLGYRYIVDGEEYYVSTDYYTSIIPKEGSVKTIKYNPENPSDAVISGFGEESLIVLLGFMFVGIPLLMLISSNNKKDRSSKLVKKIKSFITSLLISFVIFGVGFGFCYMICIVEDGFSLWSAFKNSRGIIIIPLSFMVIGIYMLFMTFFGKREKYIIVKVDSITKIEDGTYNVVLNDESIEDDSMKSILYKYYAYNTKNEMKFGIDKKFKVNIYKYGMALSYVNISEIVQALNLKQFIDDDFEEQL